MEKHFYLHILKPKVKHGVFHPQNDNYFIDKIKEKL